MSEQAPEAVDVIIDASHVVTMNADRDVIRNGAVAVNGSTIVAVGKADDIHRRYAAARTLGGPRFVLTPGMVNTHIHITGEPLTRGYVPDDTPFVENVFEWLCPLYSVFDAAEERFFEDTHGDATKTTSWSRPTSMGSAAPCPAGGWCGWSCRGSTSRARSSATTAIWTGSPVTSWRCAARASYPRGPVSLEPIVRAEESLKSLFSDPRWLTQRFYHLTGL